MKKCILVGCVFIAVIGKTTLTENAKGKRVNNSYSVRQSTAIEEFWATRDALEASGGQDQDLQKKLCGLGVECLNQIRSQVLTYFPALRERKIRVEIELSRVSRQMETLKKSKGKVYKQLQSTKKKLLYELNSIEDEVEAQLHNRADLSASFDKIHQVLAEWCD